MAQWYFWKQLWWWGSDTTEYLLPAPNTRAVWHLCAGGLQPKPDRNLHQTDGTEQRDSGHDSQGSKLSCHQYFSSRLQCFWHKSLTNVSCLLSHSSWNCFHAGVRWFNAFSALERFRQVVVSLVTFTTFFKRTWAEFSTCSNTVRTKVT